MRMLVAESIRSRPLRRGGSGALEIVVAFTLLSSVLALSAPLVVRHGRLLAGHRDYRLALEELSNQLDYLAALPEERRTEALKQLTPSPWVAKRYPEAKLAAELQPADIGERLLLRLSWGSRQLPPIALAAWIVPAPSSASGENREERQAPASADEETVREENSAERQP